MAIFKREECTEEHRKIIEKAQFKEPPEKDLSKFLAWQEECDVIYNGDEYMSDNETSGFDYQWGTMNEIIIPNTTVSKSDFATLINWSTEGQEVANDRSNVVTEYLRMVVEYVNQERAEFAEVNAIKDAEEAAEIDDYLGNRDRRERQILDVMSRSRSRSLGMERSTRVRERSPLITRNDPPVTPPKPTISCKMIAAGRFEKILDYTQGPRPTLIDDAEGELRRILQEIDCTPDNYKTLDYLFIPVNYMACHCLLMGLAPKQRYAFIIDSHMAQAVGADDPIEASRRKWYTQALGALIGVLDPAIKYQWNNDPLPGVDRNRVWYIFGQYSLRSKKTDMSPNAVQKRDCYNCGVHAMTNAFILAFGYDLECFTEPELNKWKKARIAFELLQRRFGGEYEYDMFMIPDQVVVAGAGDSDEELDSDNDLQMQYGFNKSPQRPSSVDSGYDPGSESEGSDGEVNESAEVDEGRAFLTLVEARRLEIPRTKPQIDQLPWPRQFPRKYFDRAAFVYPAPSVNFRPELRYSKRELKKACRDFPLVGWKPWSKQSQSIFLDWMLNEMAATLSLMRNDLVPPAGMFESAHQIAEAAESGDKRKREGDTEDREEQGRTKKQNFCYGAGGQGRRVGSKRK